MYICLNGSQIAGVKLDFVLLFYFHYNGTFVFHYFVQYTLKMDHRRFVAKEMSYMSSC